MSGVSEEKGGLKGYLSYPLLPLPGQPTAYLSIGQVKELDLGRKEKPDFFNCKASITFVKKDNCLYKVRLPAVYLA